MKLICAFSSDSRELYKADIYRAIALPTGATIHFRYKKKYVDSNILSQKLNAKGEKAVIFFSLQRERSNDDIKHIPIRIADIISIEESELTDTIHVYMKLCDFCNVEIDSENSFEKKPPSKYFTKLSCTINTNENRWFDIVKKASPYFGDTIFYHIKSVTQNDNPIKLRENDKSFGIYKIKSEQEYKIKLALANTRSITNSKIKVSTNSDKILINTNRNIETSVNFDDIEIPFYTTALSSKDFYTNITFETLCDGKELPEYSSVIEFKITIGYFKALLFGLLTLALATSIAQLASNNDLLSKVFSVFLFLMSSSSLFFLFNKK